MFGTLRMAFWGILFFLGIISIKKSNLLRKKSCMILFSAFILVLWTVSMLFPVENLFVTFSSPEQSFNYVNSEEVKMIVSGKISDLVIGEGNDYVYLIVPKTEEGWKIGRGSDVKMIFQQYKEGVAVSIYQYKNTQDYYVEVADLDGKQSVLKDNKNSHFQVLEQSLNEGKATSLSYAYVYNLDNNYVLNVNGKMISLKE